jgi:hypothetical protein
MMSPVLDGRATEVNAFGANPTRRGDNGTGGVLR